MAHFALVQNGIVVAVHVLNNAVITDGSGVEHEPLGQQFLAGLHGGNPSDYIQTSYNANFRGKYAGIGDRYDAVLDEFVSSVLAEESAP